VQVPRSVTEVVESTPYVDATELCKMKSKRAAANKALRAAKKASTTEVQEVQATSQKRSKAHEVRPVWLLLNVMPLFRACYYCLLLFKSIDTMPRQTRF
jgi:hypothetical protein